MIYKGGFEISVNKEMEVFRVGVLETCEISFVGVKIAIIDFQGRLIEFDKVGKPKYTLLDVYNGFRANDDYVVFEDVFNIYLKVKSLNYGDIKLLPIYRNSPHTPEGFGLYNYIITNNNKVIAFANHREEPTIKLVDVKRTEIERIMYIKENEILGNYIIEVGKFKGGDKYLIAQIINPKTIATYIIDFDNDIIELDRTYKGGFIDLIPKVIDAYNKELEYINPYFITAIPIWQFNYKIVFPKRNLIGYKTGKYSLVIENLEGGGISYTFKEDKFKKLWENPQP